MIQYLHWIMIQDLHWIMIQDLQWIMIQDLHWIMIQDCTELRDKTCTELWYKTCTELTVPASRPFLYRYQKPMNTLIVARHVTIQADPFGSFMCLSVVFITEYKPWNGTPETRQNHGHWRTFPLASIDCFACSLWGLMFLSLSRLQLKSDATRWRTGEEVKGKVANEVGSQYSSHYLGTRCIQHYYRWCAHLGCQQSTELTLLPADLNGLVRFARKTKSGFCACAITFQTQSTVDADYKINASTLKAVISICASLHGIKKITDDGKFYSEKINYVLHVEH